MKDFNLKIGGIKQMLSKDQMKKITGGYTGCENQSTIGAYACSMYYGGTYVEHQNAECGTFFTCELHG